MRIFVTGGTGFIGSHFLKQAIAAGHQIVALRRGGSLTRISLPSEPVWLDGQMDEVSVAQLTGCDCLVHFAAAGVNPATADWETCLEVNVRQSIILWRSAINAGIRRLVICGSCFEYGRSAEQYEFIPEDAPLLPTGAYHATKASATLAAMALATENDIECLILRPFHVFGEGEEENRFWPALRKAALAGENFPMTEGKQVRDFIAVKQVAAAFLKATSRSDLLAGEVKVENLGSGVPKTLREFAEFWWRQWAASGTLQFGKIPYRSNEVMRYVPALKEP